MKKILFLSTFILLIVLFAAKAEKPYNNDLSIEFNEKELNPISKIKDSTIIKSKNEPHQKGVVF